LLKEHFQISKRFSYASKKVDFDFDEKKSVFILNLENFNSLEQYIEEFKVTKHRWTNDLLKSYSKFECVS